MSYGQQIKEGYEAICQAPNAEEATQRYAEYHNLLTKDMPALETGQIMEASDQDEAVVRAMDQVWQREVMIQGSFKDHNLEYTSVLLDAYTPYFRSSGLIGVGNVEQARILGLSEGPKSKEGDDPVAEQYPDYRNYVPVFLGSAALMRVLGVYETTFDRESYETRGRVLVETGIINPDATHHLGYSFKRGRNDTWYTAGASGVLPNEEVTAALHHEMRDELEADRNRGLYSWPYDMAAGFHDVVANESALHKIALPYTPQPNLSMYDIIHQVANRRAYGQDIH